MNIMLAFFLISSLILNAALGRRVYTYNKRHKPGSIDIEAPAWRAQVAQEFLGYIAAAKLPIDEHRLVKGVTAPQLMRWVMTPAPTPPAVPDALMHLVDDFTIYMGCVNDPKVRKCFLIAILIALPELRDEKGKARTLRIINLFPHELTELREEYGLLPVLDTVH